MFREQTSDSGPFPDREQAGRKCMTNGFTTFIGIMILVLIVLCIRYILKHGHSSTPGCAGRDCASCGMGCASRFSPEKKDFDRIMGDK